MKAIKILVAGMSLLLVVGLGLLGYGLYGKSRGKSTNVSVSSTASTASVQDFGTVVLPVPMGTRLEQTLTTGERVILRLSHEGSERLLVLDPTTGTVSGSFILTPEVPVR